MYKQYLPVTWSRDTLVVLPSKIHGTGVFTNTEINEGETVMEFGGMLISRDEAYSGKYRSKSVWPVLNNLYLASPIGSIPALDEGLNHSCDANCWLLDEVTLISKRKIEVGEEITLDQGTWNFEDASYTDDSAQCNCGSTDCTGSLTKHDWLIPRVQYKYSKHFHPVVQDLIDGSSEKRPQN